MSVAHEQFDRTFEAIVFDWDGTAVPDRRADASAVRQRIEALLALGVDVAIVSGTHVGNVDGQLNARPHGPGRLWMCLNRGSEVFEVNAANIRTRLHRARTALRDAMEAAASAPQHALASVEHLDAWARTVGR